MSKTSLVIPHSKGTRNKKGKREWTPHVKARYHQSLQAWRCWKAAGRPKGIHPLWQKYVFSKRKFRSSLRQAKFISHGNFLAEIERCHKKSDNLFHRLVKTNKDPRSSKILDYKGTIYEGNDVIEGFSTYFSDLATPDEQHNIGNVTAPHEYY